MDFRKKIYGSVASRTALVVLVMVAVVLIGFGFWQTHYVRKVMVQEVHRQANRSMDNAINIIEDRISDVETALETAAGYADVFTKDDELCYQLLDRLIGHNDDISAVTLLYRENFFPEHGRYFAPTVFRDSNEGILDYDEIGGPDHDFCYLETDSNWIYTSQHLDGYWCLPYLDTMSTQRPMVTYSVPLCEPNGQIYAVLCADVALDWVKQIMEEAKPYPYSRVCVISRDQQFICHPDSKNILNTNVMEYSRRRGNAKSVEVMEKMLRWERGSDTMSLPSKASRNIQSDVGEIPGRQIVFYAPVESVLWSVSFSIPESSIMEVPNRLKTNMMWLLCFMLALLALIIYIIIHRELRPLKQLAVSTHEMAKGNFDVPLPRISRNDEIGNLRNSFAEMQTSLENYINKLQTTTAQKASMESELSIASHIQASMLPKTYPPYPERRDIEVFGTQTPAKAVGGDLYDFYIRDEKLFICIGDVSGKGIPASLVMAVTRTLFRVVSGHEATPDRIVAQINETISLDNESNMFVTLFIGVLDLPTGRFRYCNAGHDAPLIVGTDVQLLPCESNIPVGIVHNWKFVAQETIIKPQTTVFLYTDGLTEAENSHHELFTEQRIIEVARQSLEDGEIGPNELIRRQSEAMRAFVGGAEQSDDVTMLAVEYTKQQQDVRLLRDITLPNDVQTVPQLAEFVEGVCEELAFDPSTTMQLNLALEEAVVNVMSYAYPAGVKGTVRIEAQANVERLKFTITDNGVPFDPTAKEAVDVSLSAEERPIGGLGIFLVRELMDSINYERVSGQNVLTLRKKLK